jgi:hypothetical protein
MTAKKTPTRVAARAGGRGKASRSPQSYQAQPRKTSSKLPALYTDAAKALAQITRIDEAKEIRDQAHAMQVYAEQAKDPSLIEHATKVRVHAETRCGELLLEMAAQGTRAAREDNLKRGPRTNTKLVREKATLDDLKISQIQASRWKKLAMMKLAFPKNWEDRLRRMCRMAVAVTEGNKAVLAAAKADLHAEKKRLRDQHERELAEKIYALPNKRCGVIYVDPPWKFKTWSEKGLNVFQPTIITPPANSLRSWRSILIALPPMTAFYFCGRRYRCCRKRWKSWARGASSTFHIFAGRRIAPVPDTGISTSMNCCWSESAGCRQRHHPARSGHR